MIKRKIIVLMIVMAVAGTVNAVTETEKQAAIDAGLAYLASPGLQQADGRWKYYTWSGDVDDTAVTASTLLAFIEEGHTPWSGTAYSTVVENGLNFLFRQAKVVNISPQDAGNPDKYASPAGANKGVNFTPTTTTSHDSYASGMALAAIAAAGTGNASKTVSEAASPVNTWTYAQVVGNAVDYFAWGQNEDSGGGGLGERGGWGYYANYTDWSDNSNAQWPAVGIAFASGMGITPPDFVGSELGVWADYIQNDFGTSGVRDDSRDGGSNYRYKNDNSWGSNVARTGALLLQQDFAGLAPGDIDMDWALEYLNEQWNTGPSGWNGNLGHPYAMWAAYKGLEVAIGLDAGTSDITPRAQGGAVIDPGDTWNWWEDYCEFLINDPVYGQLGNGSWGGYSNWYSSIATPWYINILAATEIPTEEIPVPGAFLLGSIGLAFACRKLQRRKEL